MDPQRIATGAGTSAPTARIASAAPSWIVLAGTIALFVYGFASQHLFSQQIWTALGRRRLIESTISSFVVAAALYVWRREWLIPVVAGSAALYTIAAIGIQGPAAALFTFFSAWALGRTLMRSPEGKITEPADELLAVLAGVCVYAAFTGIAVFFRINYAALYFVLLSAPIVYRCREVRECIRAAFSFFDPSAWASAGMYAAGALLTFVVLAQWLMVLKPDASADGLAVHLAAPAWVAAHHRWDFEFRRLIWAVLPMNGDWAYTVAFFMGGEYAARVLNFGFFGLIAALLFVTIRRWFAPALAILLVAAFASSPLTQLETGSLFIDNFWSAALFGAVVAVSRARETGSNSHLILAGLFLGSAMATKPATAAWFVPLAVLIAAEMIRRARTRELRPRPVLVCCACFLVLALPPYLNAWLRTGNPVYPYLNTVFHSRWFDQDSPLRDIRFHLPLSWHTLFDITFQSHNFFEGQDGGFAFQYLLLAPFCILYARRSWPFAAWAGLGVAVFGFIATFISDANLRYIYPTLPLLLLPAAAALARVDHRALRCAIYCGLIAAIALNTWFMAASGWYHKDFYLKAWFNKREVERYVEQSCPQRRLVEYLNITAPDVPVGFLAGEETAGLIGPAWANSWHSPEYEREIGAAGSAADVLKAANSRGIEYFVAGTPENQFEKLSPAIWAFLGEYTDPEYSYGNYYVARLKESVRHAGAVYSCTDSRIHFSPLDWTRNDSDISARDGTCSMIAGRPGAEVHFDFDGQQVTLNFLKAPDHGEAAVTIDGEPRGVIDQYFPSREQASITYGGRSAPKHSLTLKILPMRHYASSGFFVDIERFVVR